MADADNHLEASRMRDELRPAALKLNTKDLVRLHHALNDIQHEVNLEKYAKLEVLSG